MLAADESLTADLFARLRTEMSVSRLVYGDRELGVALRPHFLTRPQYDLLVSTSQAVVSAFEKVAVAVIAQPAFMKVLGLTESERLLAKVDPGFARSTITSRLDAFMNGSEIKFVEYNAENPSSLTDQAGLNEILFDVPALRTFAERYRIQQFTSVRSLLDALLATFHEWGGHGNPNIAILDWANLPTESEFLLLRRYFIGRGVPTIVCTPDELEYSEGRLRRGDFAIDLVYKRVIIHEFLGRYDMSHPLIEAYLNHDVCVVNPFRCKLLHKKASFELLTDDSHRFGFSPEEETAIRRSVPWTRRLSERKTNYRGRAIDLIPYVRSHRPDFVLKPNDDYGGRGISFGNQLSEAEWDSALCSALTGDYVVQEMLDLQTEDFPIFDTDQWALQPMFVDTNPFIFRGRVDGAMVRLSNSRVVNVSSGGGETGFFVIEGMTGS